jgi:hypothetical protein
VSPYPNDPINLDAFYEYAAKIFGQKHVFEIKDLLKRRPYIFIFIYSLLPLYQLKPFMAVLSFISDDDKKFFEDNYKLNIVEKFNEIDQTLRVTLPLVYSRFSIATLIEKWYYRALGLFKEYDLAVKPEERLMSIYPENHIGLKVDILARNYMIILNPPTPGTS